MRHKIERQDDVITEIHRIRRAIIAEHGNDLRAYSEDARRRQALSGQPIWTGHSEIVPDSADGQSAASTAA